jgi:NTP pyrophosphatase (non-canonical NTP hydrolase)
MENLGFNAYQVFAEYTANYPDVGNNMVYPAMGLAGEAGEACDKAKKHWRNTGEMGAANLTQLQKKEFAKEIGDVLWYAAMYAKELGFTLEEVALMNIEKLQDRHNRGVIKSEGDNR